MLIDPEHPTDINHSFRHFSHSGLLLRAQPGSVVQLDFLLIDGTTHVPTGGLKQRLH